MTPSWTRVACGAALFVLLLVRGSAEASGPAGTIAGRETEMNLNPVGVGYYHRTLRLDPRQANFRAVTFSQDQYFVDMAGEKYGWAAFFRVGGATLRDETDPAGETRLDAGLRPFAGAGFRYHVPLSGDGATLLVGSGRVSYTFPYDGTDAKVPADPVPDRFKVKDFWSVDATLALQQRMGPFCFFAGPAVQFSRLKVVRIEGGSMTAESTYDASSNLFGAIGGFRIDLGKVALQAEAQRFETLSYGGTLSYGF